MVSLSINCCNSLFMVDFSTRLDHQYDFSIKEVVHRFFISLQNLRDKTNCTGFLQVPQDMINETLS